MGISDNVKSIFLKSSGMAKTRVPFSKSITHYHVMIQKSTTRVR